MAERIIDPTDEKKEIERLARSIALSPESVAGWVVPAHNGRAHKIAIEAFRFFHQGELTGLKEPYSSANFEPPHTISPWSLKKY